MNPGTIIVLNGTSSAGKSTLLKALQKAMIEPYLDAGIDKFIWMLPARYLDRPLWDDILGDADRAGGHGHRLFSGMHHAIAALSRRGNNVLADHVLVERAWADECARQFADLPAYLVGVRCPLNVVEAREASRRDRTLGQARKQFDVVHAHALYDLEVDTSLMEVEECVQRIARHVDEAAPAAFRRMAERMAT
jgi:chloramphenicol 3-O phosphotransferase